MRGVTARCAAGVLAMALLPLRLIAGPPAAGDRIMAPIAGSPLVWLEGHQSPLFQPENDLGSAPDSLPLEAVTLMFKPTSAQQADLAALLAEQQNPTSPLYHQWLTPEQYAARFGLSASDIAKVTAWLQSLGFTQVHAARSRTWVSFSGTAGQVRAAFQAEIHNYTVEGGTYHGPATDPAVPAALADVVQGFSALDNYPPRPQGIARRASTNAQPDFTSYISSRNFLTPGDFAIIYDLNALYNAGINGAGQKLAVMGQTDLYNDGSGPASDVATFRSLSGLPPNPPVITLVPAVTDPGVTTADIQEASLDVEWAGAVAPNATVIFVNGGAGGVMAHALPYAVDNDVAAVITISYGLCEQNWVPSELQNTNTLFMQAAGQGQSVVVAAGDSGAADCDSSSNIVEKATHGLAVDFPASSPYVTAMGGTELNEGQGNYWQAAASADVITSALSYIPEMAWNDTSTVNGILGGGGGASVVFSKPAWQTSVGVPNDGQRDVPDLALNASPVHDPYLVCVQGSCVNGFRNSTNPSDPNTLSADGGTSTAAPTFGGIVALVNQKMNTPSGQGNIDPIVYPMATRWYAAFHDITTGNNMVPCQIASGDTGCSTSGEMGYSAGPGYDQVTGLGSVDAYNLVEAWAASGPGTLPAPALVAPANGLTGTALGTSFSWMPVPGATGYRIMIATNPGDLPTHPNVSSCSGCAEVATTSGNGATSYPPPTGKLVANTVYYWQVQAIAASGTAAWATAFVFNTAVPDFGLSAAPTSLSIPAGNSGTSTLTFAPTGNLVPASVTFTCEVATALAGVTCTVGSLGSNNVATVTITAATSAGAHRLEPPAPMHLDGVWWAGVLFLALLLVALRLPRRMDSRRRVRYALVLAVAALLAASLSCGGGSPGSGGSTGLTPPSSAELGTVTVTGTSTSATHSVTISVAVTS